MAPCMSDYISTVLHVCYRLMLCLVDRRHRTCHCKIVVILLINLFQIQHVCVPRTDNNCLRNRNDSRHARHFQNTVRLTTALYLSSSSWCYMHSCPICEKIAIMCTLTIKFRSSEPNRNRGKKGVGKTRTADQVKSYMIFNIEVYLSKYSNILLRIIKCMSKVYIYVDYIWFTHFKACFSIFTNLGQQCPPTISLSKILNKSG
jgi:hypothetical protein